MPRLPRSLTSGAVIALTLAAATACGEDSTDDASDPSSRAVDLADVEFTGDEPLAWPHVDVCDGSVAISTNALSGRGDAAVFDPETGKGSTIEVELPDDAKLEPDASWRTGLACVSDGDQDVILARYGPTLDSGGSAWAAFDTDGEQLWVREFEEQTNEYVTEGLVAFKSGSLEGETVDWTFVDAGSGEEVATLESEPLDRVTPVSSDRYVAEDGLLDLAGDVVNEEMTAFDVTGFGRGTRVLAEGLELAAYDTASGDELWTSDIPAPLSGSEYDHATKTLVWRASDDVVYGVDAETGKQRWTYRLPANREASMSDVFDAGSGIVVVGAPTLGEPIVLDIKTGEPIETPDGVSVLAAGPAGIAVAADGALEIVDRAELG